MECAHFEQNQRYKYWYSMQEGKKHYFCKSLYYSLWFIIRDLMVQLWWVGTCYLRNLNPHTYGVRVHILNKTRDINTQCKNVTFEICLKRYDIVILNSTGTTTFNQIFLLIMLCYYDIFICGRYFACSQYEWVEGTIVLVLWFSFIGAISPFYFNFIHIYEYGHKK